MGWFDNLGTGQVILMICGGFILISATGATAAVTIRWYKRVGPIGAEAYAGLAGNEAQAEAQPERMGMGRSKDSVKRYVERVYAETASFRAKAMSLRRQAPREAYMMPMATGRRMGVVHEESTQGDVEENRPLVIG